MTLFGTPSPAITQMLQDFQQATDGLQVWRSGRARSSTPRPKSLDLEAALVPTLTAAGFQHQVPVAHPRIDAGYKYDFWRPAGGIAIEVMGYRADDEVYKNLLKFHVHPGTHVGVVLVPRWKWVSGRRQDRNFTETIIVMLTLPFALVGGIWLMYYSGFNMSVAVAVGFIALAGLAAETGVVMLVYLDETYERYKAEGRLLALADLKAVVMEGAVDRVRPKLMTVSTTMIGLLPVMYGTETGTRVMKRIAAPMVGGLVSSTVLTLIIIPAIYLIWRRWQHRKGFPPAHTPQAHTGMDDLVTEEKRR